MDTDPLVAQIGSYFKAYGDGFHARSGAQIADFFSVPCISIRGGAAMHWLQSRAEIEKFFQGVSDAYYEEGLRRSEIKNLELVPIGGRSLLASMDWVFYRGDGTLLKQWRQSYNLLRVDDRWKDRAFDLSRSLRNKGSRLPTPNPRMQRTRSGGFARLRRPLMRNVRFHD